MRYYVNNNAQANGDHEVHTHSCSFLPAEANRVFLGDYLSCAPAVVEAKRHFRKANGCYFCSSACHTG